MFPNAVQIMSNEMMILIFIILVEIFYFSMIIFFEHDDNDLFTMKILSVIGSFVISIILIDIYESGASLTDIIIYPATLISFIYLNIKLGQYVSRKIKAR